MIQLGNPGNFVHAIWLGEIKERLSLENKHFIGHDHLIVTGKNLYDDVGRIQSLGPDIIITGRHDCRVNCSECCDRPAYGNSLVRRYCEYLTEVGSYCMVKMLGQKADEVCESWFCQTYCDDPVNLYSGIPSEVPDINDKVKQYPLEKKIEFLRMIEAVKAGRCIEGLLRLSSRSQEVLMYKRAKEALGEIAKSRGDKDLLYYLLSDRFNEAEAQFGSNMHFAKLREWSEIYRRRKLK
ncbi:MAG: hypothetical protein V1906_00835 [Candidatus Woesearchaeota archaeon]